MFRRKRLFPRSSKFWSRVNVYRYERKMVKVIKPPRPQDPNLLHIYAQEQWHGEAYIVGNRGGLQELKRAIEQALRNGKGETGRYGTYVCPNDGEGYKVKITMNNTDWLGAFWDKLALSYTEEVASDKREDAVWPWKLPALP